MTGMNSRELEDVLKGRFVKTVLQEEGRELLSAQTKRMRSRNLTSSNFYTGRSIRATEQSLTFSHLLKHRFVDMRHHKYGDERKKRKAHPIHNRILFGHTNEIIYRLQVGFTDAVKKELQNINMNS